MVQGHGCGWYCPMLLSSSSAVVAAVVLVYGPALDLHVFVYIYDNYTMSYIISTSHCPGGCSVERLQSHLRRPKRWL